MPAWVAQVRVPDFKGNKFPPCTSVRSESRNVQDRANPFPADRKTPPVGPSRRRKDDGSAALLFPPRRQMLREMIPNLLQLLGRRPPAEFPRGFVEEVRLVEHLPRRNPRVEKLLLVCWLLIAVKCALVVWLVGKYHMNFDPLWVNAPTVMCGLLCTGVYFWRE